MVERFGFDSSKLPSLDPGAVKAVRASLPGKLLGRTAAILAALVAVFGVVKVAELGMASLDIGLSPAWLNSVLLLGGSAAVIVAQVGNEAVAARRRRLAAALALRPSVAVSGAFRIGPFLDTDDDQRSFSRADRTHEKVLAWIEAAHEVSLYLTGDSGSGKSSLLSAYVIPHLRQDGWSVVSARMSGNAEAALASLFASPRRNSGGVIPLRDLIGAAVKRAGGRLLVLLDQFEEFIILGKKEQQQFFAALISDLSARPIPNLTILIVLRSDYQTGLDDIGLPMLRQGQNFFQVGRFRENAALDFLKPLGLADDSLRRLVLSAAELDDTPGMVRPITLNVLGYIIANGGPVAPSLDAGMLVQRYIRTMLELPAIREWARNVVGNLLTERGTKRPRSEVELCTETQLRPAEVRAVMISLAEAGLARALEPTQAVWELSHDFVAAEISRFLDRRKVGGIRVALSYAAPTLLTLLLIAFMGFSIAEPYVIRSKLSALGIAMRQDADGKWSGTSNDLISDGKNFALAGQLLSRLKGRDKLESLSLTEEKISDLSPIEGMTHLIHLSIEGTTVKSLAPLAGMKALQSLDLKTLQIQSLRPIASLNALRTLDLSFNNVMDDVSDLAGLTMLQWLDLSNTKVKSISSLKNLALLTNLDLSDMHEISDLSSLRGMVRLQNLDVSGTDISDLTPLEGMTILSELNLSNTPVINLSPLGDLTALEYITAKFFANGSRKVTLPSFSKLTHLQELDLSGTRVVDLHSFERSTAPLRFLILHDTGISDIAPLMRITSLTDLDLSGNRELSDIGPIARLSGLSDLDLSETGVEELGPLTGLAHLTSIDLAGTGVSDLSPLSNLIFLNTLELAADENVTDLTPVEDLALNGTVDLPDVPSSEILRVNKYRKSKGLRPFPT